MNIKRDITAEYLTTEQLEDLLDDETITLALAKRIENELARRQEHVREHTPEENHDE